MFPNVNNFNKASYTISAQSILSSEIRLLWMDIAKQIGERIKKARESKDLSLSGLSALTNGVLSKARIGNYERGIRTPGPTEILLLSAALGERAAYLMCIDTEKERELLEYFMCLPENQKTEYVSRIKSLAKVYKTRLTDETFNFPTFSDRRKHKQ